MVQTARLEGETSVMDSSDLKLSFFKSSFICSNCCAVTLAFANFRR